MRSSYWTVMIVCALCLVGCQRQPESADENETAESESSVVTERSAESVESDGPPADEPRPAPGEDKDPDYDPSSSGDAPAAESGEQPQTIHSGAWTITHTTRKAEAVHDDGTRVELYGIRGEDCEEYAFEARILSVVGDVVSYEVDEGGFCGGARPFQTHAYKAVRLGAELESFHLSEWMGDDAYRKAVERHDFYRENRDAPDFDCQVVNLEQWGKHVAVHSLDGDQVTLAFGLPHGHAACRGEFREVRLSIPVSKTAEAELRESASQGRLMQSLAAER